MTPLPRLMIVSDRHRTGGRDLLQQMLAAVNGGARLLQIREKDWSDRQVAHLVAMLRRFATRPLCILLNGRPSLARRLGCGVHFPESLADVPRTRLPRPWGCSLHGLSAAHPSVLQGDYLLLGTLFATTCKPGHAGAGVALVRQMLHRRPAACVFGIGGIHVGNAAEVCAAGAHGVAVSSAVLGAADAAGVVRRLHEILHPAPRIIADGAPGGNARSPCAGCR